eukprot:m.203172 g.203172  ORF g.203172 m.203172 type:complete len:96 (+) comp15757_c0_seq1:215-502(+)
MMTSATPWAETPKKNAHIVYLREDIPSEYVLELFQRVCHDHGFATKKNKNGAGLTATITNGKTRMDLTFQTGRHEIKGNMMMIEYDEYQAEAVLA